MRPLDHFDAPDDRPKLRECDACPPGVVEEDEGEFIKCDSCDERVCPKHRGEKFDDLCAKCEQDARVCENCHAYGVECRTVMVGDGWSEPRYSDRRCQKCAPKAWATQEAWEGRYEAV